MARLKSNGIEIEYEEFGSKKDPALLLIGGWSVQLTFWPKPFIDKFVKAGYRVIVFDNRDAGLSTKMDRFPATSPLATHVLLARVLRSRKLTAYTLEDLAADSVGILDALGIDQAHILGLSMGGMITQIVAAEYPDRVLSATILMSTTNRAGLPLPPASLSASLLFKPPSRSLEERQKYSAKIWRRIRTQDGGYDESEFESGISSTIDRSYAPAGRKRQLEAVFATGDLRRWTRKIKAPTLVIHGSGDILARPHGGLDIAECIPHAQFELIPRMGHDIPPNRIGYITDLISEHLDNAATPVDRSNVVALA